MKQNNLGVGLLVMAFTAAIFLPMLMVWRDKSDFVPHIHYVERMLAGEPGIFNEIPNFLWHSLVIGVHFIVPTMPLDLAGVAASLWLYCFLALVLFALIRPLVQRSWAAIAITLILLLLTPIFLLTPENTYFGYLAPYVFHNPTMLPLRPLSLLLFVLAARIFIPAGDRSGDLSGRPIIQIGFAAVLTIASILSKPSFVMILLPALGLMTLIQLGRRKPVDWLLLIVGIGIPAVGLLGYQSMTYSAGGIAWYPLRTFDLWAMHYNPEANQNLLLKFFLSILFPLVVYLLYFRQASRDGAFNLAWLCFAAGAGFTYLLIDTGEPPAGNLTWNGQIGTFILMIAAALFWLRQMPRDRRFWLGGALLALHFISGIIWYGIHFVAQWAAIVYLSW